MAFITCRLSLFGRGLLSFPLLTLVAFPISVLCARNITVDDNDPSIDYSKGWASTGEDPFNVGDSHHFTSNTHATAEFNFTGTAIYLLCPLWPYKVGVQVSLDSSTPLAIDMKDPDHSKTDGPETVNSSILWSSGELEHNTHNLKISFLAGMEFAAVDAFIYTVPEGGDAPTSTDGTLLPSAGGTSSASDPTSSDPTPHTLSKEKHLSIIIAGTFGSVLVVFMLFTCLGFMWVYRRRRRAAKHVAAGFGRTLHKDGLRGVSPFTLIHPESTTAKGIQTSNILDVSNEGEPIEAVPVDVSAQVYESIRASRLKRELDRSDHATGNANTGMRDIGLATLAAQASSRSSRIVVPHISWEDGTQHDGNETEPDFVQYMDIVPGMQGSSESQAVGHENSDLPPEYTSVQES